MGVVSACGAAAVSGNVHTNTTLTSLHDTREESNGSSIGVKISACAATAMSGIVQSSSAAVLGTAQSSSPAMSG